jgi:hypothetical protein
MKQTLQVSSRDVRSRAQWFWNTNAHSPRIHTVRVLRLISWTQMGQNPYIALPCANRCGDSSQSIDLRIHSIGKIGNRCRSSSALISCSVALKNFANAERAPLTPPVRFQHPLSTLVRGHCLHGRGGLIGALKHNCCTPKPKTDMLQLDGTIHHSCRAAKGDGRGL